MLRDAGLIDIVKLDSTDAIATALPPFLPDVTAGVARQAIRAKVQLASRLGRTETLVGLFASRAD